MPEFLHGRPLSPEELEMLRQQIEEGYDNIAEVDDEIRGIVARNCRNRPPQRPERFSPPAATPWHKRGRHCRRATGVRGVSNYLYLLILIAIVLLLIVLLPILLLPVLLLPVLLLLVLLLMILLLIVLLLIMLLLIVLRLIVLLRIVLLGRPRNAGTYNEQSYGRQQKRHSLHR